MQQFQKYHLEIKSYFFCNFQYLFRQYMYKRKENSIEEMFCWYFIDHKIMAKSLFQLHIVIVLYFGLMWSSMYQYIPNSAHIL